MERLTTEAFADASAHFDALTLRAGQIDAFCSSAAWILPALQAFHKEREPFIYKGPGGYAALARGYAHSLGRFLAPLEAMWGLACPLIGENTDQLAAETWVTLRQEQAQWDSLWLGGLDPHGQLFRAMAELAARDHQLLVGPPTLRRLASLSGGVEGYLSRRSRGFRRALGKTIRRSERRGITFQWKKTISDETERRALFHRALAVDDKSWKGLGRAGLREGGMETFYEAMTRYLATRGTLRMVFAQLDGEDVAMGFGGLLGTAFRGLQMSYDARYPDLGLGNLIQWQLISKLIEEGVESYDLGTDMNYKLRWAEAELETIPLVIRSIRA